MLKRSRCSETSRSSGVENAKERPQSIVAWSSQWQIWSILVHQSTFNGTIQWRWLQVHSDSVLQRGGSCANPHIENKIKIILTQLTTTKRNSWWICAGCANIATFDRILAKCSPSLHSITESVSLGKIACQRFQVHSFYYLKCMLTRRYFCLEMIRWSRDESVNVRPLKICKQNNVLKSRQQKEKKKPRIE